jgi:hypothetical protein
MDTRREELRRVCEVEGRFESGGEDVILSVSKKTWTCVELGFFFFFLQPAYQYSQLLIYSERKASLISVKINEVKEAATARQLNREQV